ncbi:MAG TPA: DUF805 domain-containing protein [Micropepsaceae bacterium]|nr:DUF805 domain-containing protein [Micropepsaceae bacterium]
MSSAISEWALLLFSFKGRICRKTFGFLFLGYMIGGLLVFFALIRPIGFGPGVPLIAWLPFQVSFFAAVIRRLHDRGRSAWWLAVFYGLPMLVIVSTGFSRSLQTWLILDDGLASTVVWALLNILFWWGVIEIGLVRGTTGKNRFGPDPLVNVS